VSTRAFGEEDFDALRALLAAEEEQVLGRPALITVDDVRGWTRGVDLERDAWFVEDDGHLVAAGWIRLRGDLGIAIGVVHPQRKGAGLGARLLERSERQLRGQGARRIHQFTLGPDGSARELMLAHGYRDVRHFYEMAIHLDAAPPAPGAAIETFREEDARAFFAAIDDAFQDHWEHHTSPFEEWWERHRSSPGFDPSLWLLIRDGGEIAAASMNEANRNGGGYVAVLGVRRPWRGRGYGRALLLHAFREFYERGMPRVSLGVDAENPTGATKLYESVGMSVEQENVVFEKVLS
jgi:mycothiol synthase